MSKNSTRAGKSKTYREPVEEGRDYGPVVKNENTHLRVVLLRKPKGQGILHLELVHRDGRTGRFRRSGRAIDLPVSKLADLLRALTALAGDVSKPTTYEPFPKKNTSQAVSTGGNVLKDWRAES